METRWLNFFLRFSGYISNLKQKVVQSESLVAVLPSAILLIGSECVLAIVSLPLFIFVSPKKVQETGFVFPTKQRDASSAYQSFMVRRKISLFTVGSAGSIYFLKVLIVGIISFYLLGATPLLAAIQNWDFTIAGNYTYDSAKVEITGGAAQLKNLGSVTSGSTTNSGLNTDATGWTYSDWLNVASVSGAYQAAGGNPGGNVQVTMSPAKNKITAGFYSQSFTTTVNSPDTATLNLDWKSITYSMPAAPDTYQVYAYIDTGSGNPTLGTEVWSSGEVTGTTGWASASTIDIKSKVATAGTYYLKLAVYLDTPGTTGTYSGVIGFDNMIVNWSKTTVSYATDSPTITPTTSLTMSKTVSWNGFTETSTLNGGSISYQLSDDDGSTWKYWAGSSWETAGASNYNSASEINTRIGTFPKTNNKILWKAFLTSSGTQQVILDNVAIDYTENSLPVISNVSPSQGSSTGRVYIPYTLTDADSDPQTLSTYEYSLTGAFAGEQVTMTAATGDGQHSGVSSLTSSSGGTAHTFVWDAFSQLGAVYNTTVYVRLRANDGVGDSAYAASTAFTVDYVNPIVSNVVATQTAGTTNVSITYDLLDNTSTDVLIEMDISEDGGGTWNVTDTSVSGNVGSGQTIGVGKTITWAAGTDFDEQQQSDLQIRVRAKDKWQNQGTNVASSNFSLDTLNPATLTTANLQAQPNAGDTTVLVGGSFTEVNPNTNDFYVALNGGAYGSLTSGTTNTASPSNQATATGSTLNGHDYISQVKIVHTDDFGQATTNENLSPSTSYKYVKPYTPQAPVLSAPVTTVLDLTIIPNASEASDVQYALLETTTNQYVQANGSLGASAVWEVMGTGSGQWGNSTGVSGKVHVTGLSSPVANYIFKVKSRNPNDAAHAESSESAFSATAQITNTAPSIGFGTISQTTDGTKYVTINYTGSDAQGDINNLTVYEYSRDNASWSTMTEKSGVGSDGTSNLTFLSGGSSHTFMWDVGTDLISVEDTTVYVRLRSSDTLTTSALTTSSAFEVDTTLPVVSGVSAVQNAGARTVAITYTLTDANNSLVELDISEDGGLSWNVADTSVTGHVGSGVTPGSKTVTWNAGTDFDNQYQTDLQVRVRAQDTFGNQGSNTSSSNFTVDTKDPVVSSVTAVQDSGADTFTFHYDVSEDLGNVTIALAVSSDGGSTWTVPVTSATGDIGSVTPGTNKTITWNAGTDYDGYEKTNMRIRVTATDQFTNTANASSSNFNLDSLAPRVTSVSVAQIVGSTNVAIGYTLADQNTSLVELEISNDGGSTWTVSTSTAVGDIGSGVSAGSKIITWDAGVNYDEYAQANMRVRVRAKDIFNNQSDYSQSSNFAIDTLNPAVNVTADLQSQPNAGETSVSIGGSFTETNPNTNDFYVAINIDAYGSLSAGNTNTATPANHTTPVGATLDGNDLIAKVKIIHTDDYGQTVTNENTSPFASLKFVKPYTPAAPTVNNPTRGTVDVVVNKHASETDGLEYAIFETSQNKYVQANGTLGASAVWRTIAAWGTVTVNGLANDSYTYQFKTISRNTSDTGHAASSESALSGGASSANQSPVIALGTISQTTDGTEYVAINYTGSDLESENSAIITAEYSTNGTSWYTMTEKSGVGSDGTSGLTFAYTGTAHDFMWDVGIDLANSEHSATYIRLQAHDGTTSGSVTTSSTFIVDTKNPIISSVTAVQQSGSNNVTFTYILADLSNSTVELDISNDAGLSWDVVDTTVTGDVGSGISAGSGKSITWDPGVDFGGQEQSDMRVRIRATDVFGNAGANASSANFVVDTQSPRITNVTASQGSGLNTVTIGYDIADAHTSDVVIEISEDNGGTWGVATTTLSGDVGTGITSGTGKMVTWNAAVDFPNREQSGMVVRVRATDTYDNLSGNVSSSAFSVDTLAPVISNVSAVQTLGSNNVIFTYDLSDSGSVVIALDISNNSGSTWVVTDTSVTGAVGAGQTTGTGKTITWNAGTDFTNQDVSTMKVRIRGTDGFNNASTNVESSDFLLDTKSPVVLSTTDLAAQPVAGSSAATISGSFTETNPNTNEFYIALNGGAYGSSSSGDTNTASPSDHGTPTGAILDGNDYISKVKIVHTDDYGHSVTNENTSPLTSYKYVKPYTPQAPSVTNPQNTSLDIEVVANVSEAAGLEYAIFETTASKYVQADGTLGASAVWRTSAAWGTTTVTGLTSPVAQYAFKVKSRNTSDTAHAVSSESDFSSTSSISNTAPSLSITSALQQSATNYALVEYIGTDAQNDTNNLTTFEYSTDNSSWRTMTEKAGVGSDGTSGLIFASTGTAYTFAWDIATDLPNIGDPTVYVRLQSTDALASSNLVTSSAFAIDTLGPVITNIQTNQTPGTNLVTFTYDLSDSTASNNTVTLLISSDSGSTWTVPVSSATGSVGSGVTAGTNKTISWNAGTDFNNQENSTMRIELQGTDVYGNAGAAVESLNFSVDTKGAVVSGVSGAQVDGSNNIRVDYTLTDLSSGGLLVEFSMSSDNGSSWSVPVNTYSGDMGAGQTTGTKQFTWNAGVDFADEAHSDMLVRVRAKDYFNNQGGFVSSSAYALDTKATVVSNVTASQNLGARTVEIAYDLADNSSNNLTTELQISEDNGISWDVIHDSVTGAIGSGQSTGTGKTITWDAGTDFDGQFQSDMKVRVRATDRFNNQGDYSASSAFSVDTLIPIVSNVSASQTTGTNTVVITYDLADNSSNNLTTELQISGDGGSTWIVPTTSATGAIGSGVSTGTGKTISWNAGTDFSNQDISNLRVQVRATDKYSNQGNYVSSSDVAVDTKNPATLSTTDLSAQPNAGDTSVLISGSFTESHPDTNALSVAMNGGAYGSSTPGASGTATVSNVSVSVGATLNGRDFISKAKIVHTDTFGHSATNENTSLSTINKYVKPYTPSPLTVENPTSNSVDVSVNKNPLEVSGLEYLILETSTGKYVQADGSLGVSAVWQTGVAWSTITVTGLSSPVSNYIFKTKSRNSSDASHAVSSESDLSAGASIAGTAPGIVLNSYVQSAGNDYVLINYTGIDAQNDISTLVTVQYSLNNIDWFNMTEKSGVGSSGKTGLAFTSSGAAFVFAWDAAADVSNTEGNAYVRLMANDGTQDGNLATSSAFTLDLKAPVTSNVSAVQSGHNVTITYDVTDVTSAISVALEISSDNGSTWAVSTASASGAVGSGQTTGTGKTITWNADTDFDNQYQTDMKVRVRATDSFAHQGTFTESSAFTVDTANPIVSNVYGSQLASGNTVLFTYDLSDDTTSGLTVLLEISSDNGSTWTVPTTTATGAVGVGQSGGVAKMIQWNAGVDFNNAFSTGMVARIRATDGFANQGNFASSDAFTLDTNTPEVSNVTASQNTDSTNVTISYDLADNTVNGNTVTLEISSDNGSTWTVPSVTASGAVGTGIVTGTGKTISWNANTDFDGQFQSDMKVRVRATDAYGHTSAFASSSAFSLDTANPSISNLVATQTSGTDAFVIGYDLSDDSTSNLTVAIQISSDGGITWVVPTTSATGAVGSGVSTGTGKTISWNAGTDFANQEISNMRVRLTPMDRFFNIGTGTESVDTILDTSAPVGLANLTKFLATETSTTVNWTPATDAHFDHYELWYGSSQTDVQGRGGSAEVWNVADDATLASALTSSTTITGVSIIADFYVKIWAVDAYGHEGTVSDINVYSTPTPPVPVAISGGGGGSCTGIGCSPLLPLLPDEIAPTIPFLQALPTITNNRSLLVSGLSEQSSRIELYDYGALISIFTDVTNADGLFAQTVSFEEGMHVLTAKAVDAAGNTSAVSEPVTFDLDLTVPAAPLVSSPVVTEITDATPVFAGTAEALSVITITIDQTSFTTNVGVSGTWSFALPGSEALAIGSHSVSVKTTDQAGNESPTNDFALVRIAPTVSISPPVPVPVFVPAPEVVPAPAPSAELIQEISRAVELPGLATPIIRAASVANAEGNRFSFSGSTLPNARVAVYLHSSQALVYQTTANAEGVWNLDHSQQNVELTEGDHSIYAVAIDPTASVKSRPGEVRIFTVQKNIWAQLFGYLNLHTTLVTLGVLAISAVWLFALKKRGVTHV
jgi:hypothetical protein